MDVAYRPRDTALLRQASAAGCATIEGIEMLVAQGAAAFALWTGRASHSGHLALRLPSGPGVPLAEMARKRPMRAAAAASQSLSQQLAQRAARSLVYKIP
jgi:hypothetical protein